LSSHFCDSQGVARVQISARLRETALTAAARAGIEVRRKPSVLISRDDSQLEITVEMLAAHLDVMEPDRRRVVLQVGAFDGAANDPVASLLQKFQWHGVLVEPQPEAFAALARLHQSNANVQLFNVAIDRARSKRPLYVLEGDDLPAFARQFASFDPNHLDRLQRLLPSTSVSKRVRAHEVETWPFEHLMAVSNVLTVDMLQIDTEGFDLEILRMFDFARHKPAIVNYEHEHLGRRGREDAAQLLINHGYRLAVGRRTGDTLAYRTPSSSV
jgi:FkbM family methyltransferase